MFTEKDIVKYKELISQWKKPEEAKNIMRAEQNKILSTEQSFQTPNYLSSIQKKPIIDEKIQYNKRYFSDEKKIVDEMLKEWYSEDISRQTIEKRRKEILPLWKLKTDEATFLIKMADAWITSEQAVQWLNEYRNEEKKKQWDNMNIAQKAWKTYFDFVLWTLWGWVWEVWWIVDFATRGNSELGKMWMEWRTVAREINKWSIAWTTWDILGSWIIDYGLWKTLWTVGWIWNKFNKLKPVNQIIWWWAWFWALTAIWEKWSKATAEDITTSASIWAWAWLVLWKVIVPAASKVAQKGIKYWTALQKWWTEWLTKSISRDLKKPVWIFKKSIQWTADNLSTNINRMTKWEIQKFKKSHKVSVWKFLNDRWISESWDDLLEKLSENLKLSRKEANKWLEKIQWNFTAPKQQIATDIIDETTWKYKVIESDPVETMLKDNLINSSNKWLSKDSLRAKELLEKYQKDWLSMPEINEWKRWFQSNNKFSYLTDDTSSRKWFVTWLDNAVREWQFDTAIKNWFGNLREINKQTKAYYELLEGITKWNEWSKWNLPIWLTDWLAFNADPAVFLAKQITQSWKVKKGVIKFLNLWRKTQPEVTPALFSKKVKNVNNIRNSTNSPALESIQGGNLKPNQPTNVSNKPIKKASETWREVLKKILPSNFKEKAQDLVDKVAEKTWSRQKLLWWEWAKQVPSNLEKAKNWEKSWKSADDIWKETWWEKWTDWKWKFEIDDSKAKLLKTEWEWKLSDFLEHKELFKQYPELSNRKITFKDLWWDMWWKIEWNNIFINNTNIFTKEEIRATLLHELQHNIQKQEWFARWWVPKISNKLQEAQKEFDEVLSKMKTLKEQWKQTEYLKLRKDKYYQYWDKVAKLKRIADNKYKKLSWEVEARNIQARLLNKDNKIRRPELTEDVARDKQIIKMDWWKAMSVSDVKKVVSPSDDLIKEARKMNFETKWDKVIAYRWYWVTNKKWNYFTWDKDYALEFSDFWEDTIRKIEIPIKDIYKAKIIPDAVDEKSITKIINEARNKWFKAIYVNEWWSKTPSIFMIEKI